MKINQQINLFAIVCALTLLTNDTQGRPGTIRILDEASFNYPEIRFTTWENLDDTAYGAAIGKLKYTEYTWNNPATNEEESKSWKNLEEYEQYEARLIDLTEETWDCFINHYVDYTWADLNEYGLDTWYEALGWTSTMWTHFSKDNLPDTEFKTWSELSTNEKDAAYELCFFEELWDGIELNSWTGEEEDLD